MIEHLCVLRNIIANSHFDPYLRLWGKKPDRNVFNGGNYCLALQQEKAERRMSRGSRDLSITAAVCLHQFPALRIFSIAPVPLLKGLGPSANTQRPDSLSPW